MCEGLGDVGSKVLGEGSRFHLHESSANRNDAIARRRSLVLQPACTFADLGLKGSHINQATDSRVSSNLADDHSTVAMTDEYAWSGSLQH